MRVICISSVDEWDNMGGDGCGGISTGGFIIEHFFLWRHRPVLSLYVLLQFAHDNKSEGFFGTNSSYLVADSLILCFMVRRCFI